MEQGKVKKQDLDTAIMRIIAAFFVVMIHASGSGSASAIVWNAVSRFSVPVFVIVSGYYMLSHACSSRQLAKKSIRLFCLMLVWSGIFYAYDVLFAGVPFGGMRELVVFLLTEPVHLWYLYAAITLYIFTPLLYIFCAHATKGQYQYALLVTFTFGSLVTILLRSACFPLLGEIIDQMKAPYTLGFIFLYLLGGYFRRYGVTNKAHRRLLYLCGVLGTAATVVSAFLLPRYGLPRSLLLSFFAPNAMAAAAAFFVGVQQIFAAVSLTDRWQRCINRLSACTLGIYLLHPLIISIMQRTVEPYWLSLHPAVFVLLRAGTVYVVSACIVLAACRLPILKRIV